MALGRIFDNGPGSLDPNAQSKANEIDIANVQQFLGDPDLLQAVIRAQQQAQTNGSIYKSFSVNDYIPSIKEISSDTCWDDPDGYLTAFYSSSVELAYSSSNYYWNVYQNATSAASSSDAHFAIAFGDYLGRGGVTGSQAGYTGNLTGSRTPTKAIYSQYKSLLLLPTDELFTFGSTSSNSIFVVNFNRARYKEKLDPGNWELALNGSSGTRTFIDNSGANTNPTISQSGRVFSIVSGSITGGSASSTVYGLAYPDVGILVFHPAAISSSIGLAFSTASYVAAGMNSNIGKFFTAISGGASFQARTEENISSTYYFVRVAHNEFNYSNNPTFTTGSLNAIRYSMFHSDPRVYITSVGLYNNDNELLAIAKMSRPILKSFTREALIRVRLDF
jgi:hypothetical protein